jgi:XTP/dITP diphosphohydrolase
MLDIVIATRNRHKARELSRLLRVRGVRWRSLAEFPPAGKVREDGRTFDANARKKALAAARATGRLALADDSGIEVKALGWAPGIRSARFAGAHGDDRRNNEKLLQALAGVPGPRRAARYRCSLALASPARVVALTRGTWNGRIADTPRGRGGFGYDPLFLLPRRGKTVGQLPARAKERLSHRAIAARRMRPVIQRMALKRSSSRVAGPPAPTSKS